MWRKNVVTIITRVILYQQERNKVCIYARLIHLELLNPIVSAREMVA